MNNMQPHSSTWVNFVYGSFFGAVLLAGIGIFFLPTDLWTKGYIAMSFVMTIMSSIIVTKTVRDNHDYRMQNEDKYFRAGDVA
jgi:hypothetical protein